MTAFLPDGFAVFLMLLTFIMSFLAYWLVIENPAVRASFIRHRGEESGAVRFFVFNKLWGTLLFGIVCTIVALIMYPASSLSDFGLNLPLPGSSALKTLAWSLGLSLPLVLANYLRSKKTARTNGNFGRYPEIQTASWNVCIVVIEIALWSLYLFSYELLFRGTLLFTLIGSLGFWPAIGINIALYSAVHVPKGAAEAIGALALGFVLCLITIDTGSILVAIIVHIALAVSNDLFSFHFRKDICWEGSLKGSGRGVKP
ncbi:hypothetical protein MASR2M48_10040 [Spirochaetota bacterium]